MKQYHELSDEVCVWFGTSLKTSSVYQLSGLIRAALLHHLNLNEDKYLISVILTFYISTFSYIHTFVLSLRLKVGV